MALLPDNMDSRYYREAGATVRNIFGFKKRP